MKKNLITFVLCLAAMISMTACGTKETKTETTAADATPAETGMDIDLKAAGEFAAKVESAVAAKDLSALADLVTYPVYVGLGEGQTVETKEDFLKLDAAKVFDSKLVDAIASVDNAKLSATEAGIVLGAAEGKPNIIFSAKEDGSFGITGINY